MYSGRRSSTMRPQTAIMRRKNNAVPMVEHRNGIGVYNAIASLPVRQGVARFSCDSSTCPHDNIMERVSLSRLSDDYQHTRPRVRRSACAGCAGIAARARSPRDTHLRQRTAPQPRGQGRTAQEIPRRRPHTYANAQTTFPAARQSRSPPAAATKGKQQSPILFKPPPAARRQRARERNAHHAPRWIGAAAGLWTVNNNADFVCRVEWRRRRAGHPHPSPLLGLYRCNRHPRRGIGIIVSRVYRGRNA